jgi:hypothetical protein
MICYVEIGKHFRSQLLLIYYNHLISVLQPPYDSLVFLVIHCPELINKYSVYKVTMPHTCLTYVAGLKRRGIYLLLFANMINSLLGIVMTSAIDVPLGAFGVSSSCLRLGLERLSHTWIYCHHRRIRLIRPVKRRWTLVHRWFVKALSIWTISMFFAQAFSGKNRATSCLGGAELAKQEDCMSALASFTFR